jgi:hypothetical protein
MTKIQTIAAVLCGYLAGISTAGAASRAIMFTPSDLGSANAVQIPTSHNNTASYVFNVILPPDYQAGTTAKLRLMVRNGGVIGCAMFFGVSEVHRLRDGLADVLGAPETHGMPNGVMKPVNLRPNVRTVLTYQITGMTSGPMTGQLPGDGLQLFVDRDGFNSGDTCGGVYIHSGQIIYSTN